MTEIKLSKLQLDLLHKMNDGYKLMMGNGGFLIKDNKVIKVNRNVVFSLSDKGYLEFHTKKTQDYYGYFTLKSR